MRRITALFSAVLLAVPVLFCSSMLAARAEDIQNTITLTEEERDYIAAHPVLKVGYVQDRIPISFADENGECAGISRYIFDRVRELCGIDFEYVPLPTGDVTYDYLLSEGFDLVTSVEYNKENKKARGILISEPYLSSRKVIVARQDMEFSYDEDWSVAVSTGSQTLKKVLAATFPNFALKDYASITDCFDAVNNNDADLMILNQYVVEYWLAKPKYEDLKVIPIIGLDDQLCFSAVVAFADQTGSSQEEGELLINILDKAISSIPEGEIGNYVIQGVMENQYEFNLSDFVSRYKYTLCALTLLMLMILALTIMLIRQRIQTAESRADAKAKGQFLSTMSHEIRTPLNGLIGLNYLMSQKLGDKTKMEDYLRQSSITAKYLLSLVNDILDSFKLEEERMELVMQPVELALLIKTVGSIEQNAINEKGLVYNAHTEIQYPLLIGDEVRIQQVILNLLDNARKFTPAGGRIDLTLSQKMTAEQLVQTTITISDNGRGMSEEFQKQIFKVFSQERETVSKGNQGTGLGLSISHKLAKLMGGDLTCVSKKGVGSTFTFTFLAKPAQVSAEENAKKTEAVIARPHILVAEDNELNAEILLELLHSEGYEADLAENGRIALQKFTASAPGTYGIILMDLLMPEMDGFETTKAIRALDREDSKSVRIIACTANAFSEEREEAYSCGMNDFIAKPVDVQELFNKLHA